MSKVLGFIVLSIDGRIAIGLYGHALMYRTAEEAKIVYPLGRVFPVIRGRLTAQQERQRQEHTSTEGD